MGVLLFSRRHYVDYSIMGYSQNHIDLIFNENNSAAWRLFNNFGGARVQAKVKV